MVLENSQLINNNQNQRNNFISELIKVISTPPLWLEGKCLFFSFLPVNVNELSKVIGKPANFIVSFFWERGQKITKNQNISQDLLQQIVTFLGLSLKRSLLSFNIIIGNYWTIYNQKKEGIWKERSPVVSVMGHIDHGKTTLVDTICSSSLQKKEAGQVTQKVTLLSTEFQKKEIFIFDTPGHSDFIRLRQRGVSLVDLVVLVVSQEEGIMKQTEEVIEYILQYSLPTIVFLNQKKETKEEEKNNLYLQLEKKGLNPLEWGGDTIIVVGSAKDATLVPFLLENVFLLLPECRARVDNFFFGVVVDSFLHFHTNAIIIKVLVQSGTIKIGEKIFVNGFLGQVKSFFNEDLKKKKNDFFQAGEVASIIGCNFLVELGDRVVGLTDDEFNKLSKEISFFQNKGKNFSFFKRVTGEETIKKQNTVNLFLIADTQNSLQTLFDLVERKKEKGINLVIIDYSVGKINASQWELIRLTNSIVISFNIFFKSFLTKYIKENNIIVFSSDLIYVLIDNLNEIIERFRYQQRKIVEKKTAEAQVKVVYQFSKGNIAGCFVVFGVIDRNSSVVVFRQDKKIFSGKIKSLEVNKINKKEVRAGQDVGIVLEKFNDFQINDRLVFYLKVEEIVKEEN